MSKKYDSYHDDDVVKTAKSFATPLMVGKLQKYGQKIAETELEAAEKVAAAKASVQEAKAAKAKFKADAERIAYEHTANMAELLQNDDEIQAKQKERRKLMRELHSIPDLTQEEKEQYYDDIAYIDNILAKLGYVKPQRPAKKTTTTK